VVPAVTAVDAREAIATRPPGASPGALREGAAWEGPLGAALLLGGDAAGAVAPLEKAAAACNTMLEPIAQTRALARLGAAREATGDKSGACKAYSAVLARWGSAKPRSVTADEARARVRALGCGM
jgi:serine/threonine-protein kinase